MSQWKRWRTGLVAAVLCAWNMTAWAAPGTDKPNIILIAADDMGYADLSGAPYASEDIQTPGIDRLVESGTLFTQGYVTSPVCSASRAGFLTGRYQQRWDVLFYGGAHVPHKEFTIAELLKKQGYVTGMVGKQHTHQVVPGKHHPMDGGFDSFYGFNHGTQHYFIHSAEGEKLFKGGNLTAGPMMVNRGLKDEDGYATTLFEREAVNFVEKNKDDPFFLYLSFSAVHLFIQIPEKDREERGIKPFPMWDPKKEPGHGGYIKWYYRTLRKFGDSPKPYDPDGRARYQVCLEYMDRAVGALMDKLQEHGLDENTMVIFISDNGGSPRSYSNNKPLRGWKYNLYEGGTRVPFIVRWPKVLPAGKLETGGVVSSLDILPTAVAAAGGSLPTDREYDGINLLPMLRGDTAYPVRTLYWKKGRETAWSVRHGDWKLVKPNKGAAELYDLARDVGESQNLAGKQPELLKGLTGEYQAWEKKTMAGVVKPAKGTKKGKAKKR